MYGCYEYSKVLKWKLWMCRMNFQKKICQKFLNELCIWGTRLKIPLFWGAYFNGIQHLLWALEGPHKRLQSLSNTPPQLLVTQICPYFDMCSRNCKWKCGILTNFPEISTKTRKWPKYRLFVASCRQWNQNSEKTIYASSKHRKRLFRFPRLQ